MKRPGIARYYATALLANLSQGYLDGKCLFRVATSYSLTIEAVIRNVSWPKTGGLSTAIQVGTSDPEDVHRPWNPLFPAINFALLR